METERLLKDFVAAALQTLGPAFFPRCRHTRLAVRLPRRPRSFLRCRCPARLAARPARRPPAFPPPPAAAVRRPARSRSAPPARPGQFFCRKMESTLDIFA